MLRRTVGVFAGAAVSASAASNAVRCEQVEFGARGSEGEKT